MMRNMPGYPVGQEDQPTVGCLDIGAEKITMGSETLGKICRMPTASVISNGTEVDPEAITMKRTISCDQSVNTSAPPKMSYFSHSISTSPTDRSHSKAKRHSKISQKFLSDIESNSRFFKT